VKAFECIRAETPALTVALWKYNPGDVFKNIPRFIIPGQLFIHPRSVICGPLLGPSLVLIARSP